MVLSHEKEEKIFESAQRIGPFLFLGRVKQWVRAFFGFPPPPPTPAPTLILRSSGRAARPGGAVPKIKSGRAALVLQRGTRMQPASQPASPRALSSPFSADPFFALSYLTRPHGTTCTQGRKGRESAGARGGAGCSCKLRERESEGRQ